MSLALEMGPPHMLRTRLHVPRQSARLRTMTLAMSYVLPSALLACHHGFGCELDTHMLALSSSGVVPLSSRQFSAGYGSGFEDGEKSEDSWAFAIAIFATGAFVPSTPMYCRWR